MSEPYGCREVEAVDAELALGVLAGPERAEALAHLQQCAACAQLVDDLARTGDRLLVAVPAADPPDGFEVRALAGMADDGDPAAVVPPMPRRPKLVLAAAVVIAVLAIAVGAVAYAMAGDRPSSSVVVATMTSEDGERVGEVYLRDGDPAWVFVAVPGWQPPADAPARVYDMRLDLAGGRTVVVPKFTLEAGDGAWGTTVDVDVDSIEAVALVGESGRVWCSATIAG